MDDNVLTDAAKLAINRQLRRVLLPTGIVASVVAFLLGFFVNEVARSNAYTTALEEFTSDIQKISTDVGTAKGRAEASVRDVELILVRMHTSKAELDELAADITVKANSLQGELASLEGNITQQLNAVKTDVTLIEERVDRKLAVAELQAKGLKALRVGETESANLAFREAEYQITAGLRESPNDLGLLSQQGFLYKNQAIAYLRLGKNDEANDLLVKAETAFQKILDIDEKNADSLNGLGSVCILRGDLDCAEMYVLRALEIDPDYQAAKNDLQLIQILKQEEKAE